MTIQDTVTLWRNAIRILGDRREKRRHKDAEAVIKVIYEDWTRRQRGSIDPTEYFSWPSTEATSGDGSLVADSWIKEGVFQVMGYRVGNIRGESEAVRRRLLREIFACVIPPIFPPRYVWEWGSPSSAQRLRKMAETIASFTRNAKRRDESTMAAAINDWESGLEFLYYEYYVGRFHFAWPGTTT